MASDSSDRANVCHKLVGETSRFQEGRLEVGMKKKSEDISDEDHANCSRRPSTAISRSIRTGVLILIAAFSSLIVASPKTPNGGWMGQYVAPEFPPLFTGIPVFRPMIPFEVVEYHFMQSQWVTGNLLYGLLVFLLLAMLYFEAENQNSIIVLAIASPPLLVIIYFAARGGPPYDIVFACALLVTLILLRRLPRDAPLAPILLLAAALAALDHSRPTGLGLAILLFVICVLHFRRFRLVLLVVLGLFTLPFHIHQFAVFGNVPLSTYGGANLREVFPFGRDCVNEGGGFGSGLGGIDSRTFSDCANETASTIFSRFAEKPYMLLSALDGGRPKTVLLPDPYWHGAGLSPDRYSALWIPVYRLWVLAIYVAGILATRPTAYSIAGILTLAYGCVTTLAAHSGFESVRIMMPFVSVAVWMTLGLGRKMRRPSAFGN